MRADCEHLEGAISFSRRVLHGRLDILESEARRRRDGEAASVLDDLVLRLPHILAERDARPAGRGARRVVTPAPDCVRPELQDALDQVVGPSTLASLDALSDESIDRLTGELRVLE